MSFESILSELDSGNVIQRIDEKLSEVIEAVQETHDTGSITVTLKIKESSLGRATIEAKVESKVPQHPFAASLYFFGGVPGVLTRENERQGKLPLGDGGHRVERVNADGEVE